VTKLSKLGKSSGFFFVQQFRMEALRDLWTGAGLNAIEGWHYGLILAAFIRHLVDRGLNGVRRSFTFGDILKASQGTGNARH
jgi:hypothetical protein